MLCERKMDRKLYFILLLWLLSLEVWQFWVAHMILENKRKPLTHQISWIFIQARLQEKSKQSITLVYMQYIKIKQNNSAFHIPPLHTDFMFKTRYRHKMVHNNSTTINTCCQLFRQYILWAIHSSWIKKVKSNDFSCSLKELLELVQCKKANWLI